MQLGLLSGCLWGLDTVILGIALALAPFTLPEAVSIAAIVSSAFHDTFCAIWMFVYMATKRRLKDTVAALKMRGGRVIVFSALLGGPVGMTAYVVAINNIGPGITAIISSFYPAFGTLLAALVLKERMQFRQIIALVCAMCAIVVMGAATSSTEMPGQAILGLFAAFGCVIGWGSEAVISGWGMKDEACDNEVALQIRETTSALVYLLFVLPVFGAWWFGALVFPTAANGIVALAAISGTASYLFYYKAISRVGAAKAMAANISYSAWAVLFGLLLLGHIPSLLEVVCCVVILVGTVLASANWDELFSRKKRRTQ